MIQENGVWIGGIAPRDLKRIVQSCRETVRGPLLQCNNDSPSVAVVSVNKLRIFIPVADIKNFRPDQIPEIFVVSCNVKLDILAELLLQPEFVSHCTLGP